MQAPRGALGQNKKFRAWRQAVSKPKLLVLSRPNAPLGAFMHMMPRLQLATNLSSWISLPVPALSERAVETFRPLQGFRLVTRAAGS